MRLFSLNKHNIIAFLMLVLSCSSNQQKTSSIQVFHKGALKNFMHIGDISPKANLKELESQNHVYALGALAELKGEFIIIDSKLYTAKEKEGNPIIGNYYTEKASLLINCTVNQWKDIPISDSVVFPQQLENHLLDIAKAQGVNIENPFPFILEGNIKRAKWHIINWDASDSIHSHQKHIESGLNGIIENENVILLGFYSSNHHGIYTHHSSNFHLHLLTKDKTLSGHLDDFELNNGMILKLPLN